MPVLAVGLARDRFVICDPWWLGFDVDALVLDALDHQAQMHFSQAMNHQLAGFALEVRFEGRVFLANAGKDRGDLVFVAAGLRDDGEAVQGFWVRQRPVVHVVESVVVVEHVSEV